MANLIYFNANPHFYDALLLYKGILRTFGTGFFNTYIRASITIFLCKSNLETQIRNILQHPNVNVPGITLRAGFLSCTQ